jgi:hypothetical protein
MDRRPGGLQGRSGRCGEEEVSSQLHTLAALPQGESPRCLYHRRLSEPQSQSGRRGVVSNRLNTQTAIESID